MLQHFLQSSSRKLPQWSQERYETDSKERSTRELHFPLRLRFPAMVREMCLPGSHFSPRDRRARPSPCVGAVAGGAAHLPECLRAAISHSRCLSPTEDLAEHGTAPVPCEALRKKPREILKAQPSCTSSCLHSYFRQETTSSRARWQRWHLGRLSSAGNSTREPGFCRTSPPSPASRGVAVAGRDKPAAGGLLPRVSP